MAREINIEPLALLKIGARECAILAVGAKAHVGNLGLLEQVSRLLAAHIKDFEMAVIARRRRGVLYAVALRKPGNWYGPKNGWFAGDPLVVVGSDVIAYLTTLRFGALSVNDGNASIG
ncbi:hypothetical protein Thi970DRAFT_01034 [Thiorhodovibrio frisius]|uniref:Uncharacterized protein n=1 Tax=Thiorhodovibrio frisius TaxID=631362 RepID=H8YY46_9GAMM|nr:hypothetical protein Thi970DRAFT_01034 [Thiorhodovibrio frisius]WPL23547.1 hypothetical protein Thiofri_03737 [Thiorhodovibrio frisius]